MHGIALGKSAISGSLFCAVFRTVTKHDITKSNANRACCHRSVEHDGWVNSRRQRRSWTGRRRSHNLFIKRPAADFLPSDYLISAVSRGDTSSQAAYCLSVMKYAWRFLSVMPPLAIRLSKSAWLTILWPSLTILFAILFNGPKN